MTHKSAKPNLLSIPSLLPSDWKAIIFVSLIERHAFSIASICSIYDHLVIVIFMDVGNAGAEIQAHRPSSPGATRSRAHFTAQAASYPHWKSMSGSFLVVLKMKPIIFFCLSMTLSFWRPFWSQGRRYENFKQKYMISFILVIKSILNITVYVLSLEVVLFVNYSIKSSTFFKEFFISIVKPTLFSHFSGNMGFRESQTITFQPW